jgi:tyrosine-protein phosphatase non-receptor type 9
MLTFLQRVREKQSEMVKQMGDTWAGHVRGPPIIVHCSAGIGRTGENLINKIVLQWKMTLEFFLGTFITLDICISRLEDIETVDIRGTVEKIRAQRAYSIQMPEQYVFCHLALIEYALANKLLNPDVNLNGFYDDDDSE